MTKNQAQTPTQTQTQTQTDPKADASRPPAAVHISLNVRHLAASVAFYRGLLGVAPSKLYPTYARFTPGQPPLVLSLVEHPSAAAGAGAQRLSHLGIRVEQAAELDAARERLVAAGIQAREEPNARCCYAVQDKLWAVDPDGNEWEIYRLLDDLETIGEDAKDCCS
jgi:catechol 2,3-dioxygenase-like lactoylglutathione lyase family enzyme